MMRLVVTVVGLALLVIVQSQLPELEQAISQQIAEIRGQLP